MKKHQIKKKNRLLQIEYIERLGQLQDIRTGLCITLADDVREGGALLALRPCYHQSNDTTASSSTSSTTTTPSEGTSPEEKQAEDDDYHDDQYFTMIVSTGEIHALTATNPICMTGGWPFLSSVSFVTEDNQHVSIIMNEASVGTTVTFIDVTRENVAEIPILPRSIQTIVYPLQS